MGQHDSSEGAFSPLSDCETLCPVCPSGSLRDGKTFEIQLQNLPKVCIVTFSEVKYDVVECVESIDAIGGSCEQAVDITLCEGTPSEQTISCCLTLDYLQLRGELELLFNIAGQCDTDCLIEPKEVNFHAVAAVPVDELCYYCAGTRPSIENGELCDLFSVVIDSVSETGLVTYTVQFLDCPPPKQ